MEDSLGFTRDGKSLGTSESGFVPNLILVSGVNSFLGLFQIVCFLQSF